MILGFMSKFPDGKDAMFLEKLISARTLFGYDINSDKCKEILGHNTGMFKVHTMRRDQSERWKSGIPVHCYYNSRNKKSSFLNKDWPFKCTGVQQVSMTFEDGIISVYVDGKKLDGKDIDRLIANDGLTKRQFVEWFFREDCAWSGKLIHFTMLRY